MRVLWFCNCSLKESDIIGTGSWLGAMACGLLDSGSFELGVVATGPVGQFTRSDFRRVSQWLVPFSKLKIRDGLPQTSIVQSIVEAVKEFCPDIIHIWGTEAFWGLLTARGLLAEYPTLLEMQGLRGQIAKVFCGGLTPLERFKCIGIKEILKRRTMVADRRDYELWGAYENEMILAHRFIDVQSSWVSAKVSAVNPVARQFSVDLPLRQPFYDTVGWQSSGSETILFTAAYVAPFKGLHVAIRALYLIKKRFPKVRLRIVGALQRRGLRQDGYMRWVDEVIQQSGLESGIEWVGVLNAKQIVSELKAAAAVVIPTFIENCCTAMQEAMAVGTPVVASYAGGIPSLGKDEESCLFFPPGDEAMCAYQLERVLTDSELAHRLSHESRRITLFRNDTNRIVQKQLEIYREVIASKTAASSAIP